MVDKNASSTTAIIGPLVCVYVCVCVCVYVCVPYFAYDAVSSVTNYINIWGG